MTDTIEQLIRERDEARASVAALRATLNHAESRLLTISEYYSGDALSHKDTLSTAEAIRSALSQPNPGATLLEHLREIIATRLMGHLNIWRCVDAHGLRCVDTTAYPSQESAAEHCPPGGTVVMFKGVPAYELEIGPAFQAVEAMRARGYRPLINTAMDGAKWYVEMPHRDLRNTSSGTVNEHLPTAIALAIRAALESENQ